jgi:hypothetical protein
MFLLNISTEHKAFIKKTQTPVFGISIYISARHDSTIHFFIFNNNKIVPKNPLHVIDGCTI